MALGAQLPIRLDPETEKRLEEIAKRLGTKKSSLLRMLAETFVEQVVQPDGSVNLPPNWRELLPPRSVRYSEPSNVYLLKEEPSDYSTFNLVPTVGQAAAGDAVEFEAIPFDPDNLTETDCTHPEARAVIIKGDSMEPLFRRKSRIIVLPEVPGNNGDYVVANLKNDGVVFKRIYLPDGESSEGVYRVELRSINPKYAPKLYKSSDFHWIYLAKPQFQTKPRK